MISSRKLVLAGAVLALSTSVAFAQETKDNDVPVGPGQSADTVFGPDGFGYIGYDSDEPQCSYNFIDISATGTFVGEGDDQGFPVNLPGAGFSFYGSNYTTLAMTSNGYISTDSTDTGPDLSNDCPLPATPSTGGGARLYPLHDDLDAEPGVGTLLFQYFASCPRPSGAVAGEGCYVFQWNDVEHFPGGSGITFTFQAVLYEASGAIAYQQGPGNPEAGSGSTTGIQNLAATDGLTYACNTADSVVADSAQCIFNPAFPPLPIVDSAATFTVEKTFDDGNPGEVEVTISCNTGLPLEQSTDISEGDGVVFIVGDFADGDMDCVITETGGSEGYDVSYDAGAGATDEGCSFEGVLLNSGYACSISNTLLPVTFEVTKEWIDENPQFNGSTYAEASYNCFGEQFFDHFGGLSFLGNPSTDSFDVFPHWDGGTTCTVTENLVEGGIEVDSSDCQSVSVLVGGSASCTIVNTRLYEGIPTLSQYGLGVLALLMLGMGFVAVRRFV